MIIASCFALVGGFFGLFAIKMASVPVWSHHSNFQIAVVTFLVVSIFEIVGFLFGMNSSIKILRRKQLRIIIIGIDVLVFAGFLSLLLLLLPVYTGAHILAYLFGVPCIALSILGTIFVAVRKQEFAQLKRS